MRTRAQEAGDERRGLDDLLEVVEHEQETLFAQDCLQLVDELGPVSRTPSAWAMTGATKDGSVIGASATKPRRRGRLRGRGCHTERQPGLAHATRTGQGEERNVVAHEQLADHRSVLAPARSRECEAAAVEKEGWKDARRSWQLWSSTSTQRG